MIFLTLCLCVRAPRLSVCLCASLCISVSLYIFHVCCVCASASSFTFFLYFCFCAPVCPLDPCLPFLGGFMPVSLSDGRSTSQALKEEELPVLNPPQLRKGRFQVGQTVDTQPYRGLSSVADDVPPASHAIRSLRCRSPLPQKLWRRARAALTEK